MRKTKNQVSATRISASQIITFMLPMMSPTNGMSRISGSRMSGMRSISGVPSVP